MNLIDKLLCVDKAKTEEKETKKIKSKKLERLVGENAEITIRELSGKRYNSLQAMLYDKNGNRDMAAVYDFNLTWNVNSSGNVNNNNASNANRPASIVQAKEQ